MSSGTNTKLYAVLAIVIVIAGAATAVLVLMQQPTTPTGPSVRVVGSNGSVHVVTLNQMKTMTVITRNGSFQNSYGNIRGAGEYKGVKIADLIELAGGMATNQLVFINATDGYNQTFSYRNVYPNSTGYNLQGDMVLAFSYNGTEVPTWTDGFRILFLPLDGYFNNSDGAGAFETDFYSGAAGPKCVSKVSTIQVGNRPPVAVSVKIGGHIINYTMSKLMSLPATSGMGGYKKSSGNITGIGNYTGVAILELLTASGTLPANYSLRVISSDAYETVFNRTEVEGRFLGYYNTNGSSVGVVNCTLIVAYKLNGTPLASGSGPLRMVILNKEGYVTDGSWWAKLVANVTLIDEVKPWSLQLKGAQSWNMPHTDYYSMASCTHHRHAITVGPNVYWGSSLWDVVASFDGGSNRPHYEFNVSLATHGYTIYLIDGNGDNVSFTAAQLAGNDSIVVAGWINGELLVSPNYPLVVVTPGHLWLSNIVKIEMTGWNT
jgi:hypothetical protein